MELDGGNLADALVDFTGGVAEMIQLKDEAGNPLFKVMCVLFSIKYLYFILTYVVLNMVQCYTYILYMLFKIYLYIYVGLRS